MPAVTTAGGAGTCTPVAPGGRVHDDTIARALAAYLRLTPVLWVLGVLTPAGMALLAGALCRRTRAMRPSGVALLWWSVGVAQALSVYLNWWESGKGTGFLLYRLGGMTVSGWFFLGAAIDVGRRHHLDSPQVIRGVCHLGLYLLVIGSATLGLATTAGVDAFSVTSPVGLLLPRELPAVQNAFTMRFFAFEETMGYRVPRLILFYPWSVCLGFAGIATVHIARLSEHVGWRVAGMVGGVVAVAGSMSRAAIAALVITSGLWLWASSPLRLRRFVVAFLCAQALVIVSVDPAVVGGVSDVYQWATDVRLGSSEARQIGYDEAWDAFLLSPAIGYGWPGDPVSDAIPMPVGSHSSVYGLLYTGGLVTFVPFCAAMLWTLAALTRRARSGQPAARSALCIGVALCLLSYGEGIYSFAVPVLFAFCWLGAALSPRHLDPHGATGTGVGR